MKLPIRRCCLLALEIGLSVVIPFVPLIKVAVSPPIVCEIVLSKLLFRKVFSFSCLLQLS